MYKVIGLKDYGTWLRKGEECLCNDSVALDLLAKGFLKVLEYHITSPGIRWNKTQTYKKLKEKHEAIDMKIKGYEAYFKKTKSDNLLNKNEGDEQKR